MFMNNNWSKTGIHIPSNGRQELKDYFYSLKEEYSREYIKANGEKDGNIITPVYPEFNRPTIIKILESCINPKYYNWCTFVSNNEDILPHTDGTRHTMLSFYVTPSESKTLFYEKWYWQYEENESYVVLDAVDVDEDEMFLFNTQSFHGVVNSTGEFRTLFQMQLDKTIPYDKMKEMFDNGIIFDLDKYNSLIDKEYKKG